MTVDHGDERREWGRERLPSREMIDAIDDIPSLQGMLDDLDQRIKHIEVDLEFEVGDDDWDRRARGALSAHRICFGHVSRRLKHLQARVKPDKSNPDFISAKAEKARASAERQAALAAAAKAAKEDRQVALQQARLTLVEQTTFQSFFLRAAARLLDPETFDRVTAAAQKMHVGAIKTVTPQSLVQPTDISRAGAAEDAK